MVEINKIMCMDCLEYLKLIPDSSVDLVVTDPPYNVSQKQNIKHKRLNVTKNFGDWDYGFEPEPVLGITAVTREEEYVLDSYCCD